VPKRQTESPAWQAALRAFARKLAFDEEEFRRCLTQFFQKQ
jgi:hypothetical protein